MNINKGAILIFLSLLTGNAYCQIDIGKPGGNTKKVTKNDVVNALFDFAKYNGTVSGYAELCSAKDKNEQIIKNKMNNSFMNLKITASDSAMLDEIYEEAKKRTIQSKKPTGDECLVFNSEYSKIVSSIK